MKPISTFRVLSFAIVALCVTLSGCDKPKNYRLKTRSIRVDSLKQIVLVQDSLVEPLLYTNVSGLEELPVPQAKAKFISAVLPSVLVARYEVEESRRKVSLLKTKKKWTMADSAFYQNLKMKYKAGDMDDLVHRMGTLPTSIVLAQAAVESGWGQSRFFLEGSNLFGVWSFNKYEPRIAAARTRSKKKIYLRAYPDMSESIVHYFEILGKAKPYQSLRDARLQTDNPFELLPHLANFSERRHAYTEQLRKVIVRNNLTRYDQYQIDPEFIIEE